MQDKIDISIISLDIEPTLARTLSTSIVAAWPTSVKPGCRIGINGRITASLVDSCDALVLQCGTRTPPPHLLMELIALRETSLPIIVISSDPETITQCKSDDFFVLDNCSNSSTIAGVIAGATYRTGEVSSLLHETGQTRIDYTRIDRRLTKLNRELEDAARVQQEFLPARSLDVPGGTITTLWRPAGHVSGDGCAVHQLDEDRTLLFLADAIGHGVPAAMLSIMLQRVLLEAVRHDDASMLDEPGLLMRRLNEVLLQRQSGNTRFATAACAVYDARTNMMKLASAGHPPLLRTRSDGTIASLAASGSLLGVFEDEHYSTSTISLQTGDRIVLYSDGIEEACRDSAAESGDEALARCCTQWSSTLDFVDAMDHHVTENHARRVHEEKDDLTLVCLDLHDDSTAEQQAA